MKAMMGTAAASIAVAAVSASAQSPATVGYQVGANNPCCAPVELYTAPPPGSVPASYAEVGAAYTAASAENSRSGEH